MLLVMIRLMLLLVSVACYRGCVDVWMCVCFQERIEALLDEKRRMEEDMALRAKNIELDADAELEDVGFVNKTNNNSLRLV